MTINFEAGITHNPLQCGGKPCIRGIRIHVSDILQMLHLRDAEDEQIFQKARQGIVIIIMGVVHGFCKLCGSLLTAMVQYELQKGVARVTVAASYGTFG